MKTPPDWAGETVVCIASGPSLTQADCDLVRDSGHRTIAVNTSFRRAMWAHALYAGDRAWWKEYSKELVGFEGDLYAYNSLARDYGNVHALSLCAWFAYPGNSGAGAISLAIAANADKIILIGYDCSTAKGYHWHGAHGSGMSNCISIKRWPAQFKSVSDDAKSKGISIINASRDTALTCFDRADLEDVL
jgi:hypothetical protein